MEENYLIELEKQFANSIGKLNLLKSYSKWLKELEINKNLYRKFLIELGLDLNNSSTIEVDKGPTDTISLENTGIISNYMESNVSDEICNNILVKPQIVEETIITHNPYDTKYLNKFVGLRNFYIGVFGNITDADFHEKVHKLDLFKSFIPYYSEIKSKMSDNTFMYVLKNK